MIAWIAPQPTGMPALVAIWTGFAAFVVLLLVAAGRRGKKSGERRAGRSWLGVAIQAIGFVVVGYGPIRVALASDSALAIAQAAVVVTLMVLCVGLFLTASRAMGRNWSIVARTRSDHELVTEGPFAWVRHPIYTGLFAYLLAMAIAFGHWRGLILGVPLYWIGTMLRVFQEERLLRAQFGSAYDAYARRVKRFVPGIL